MCDQHAPDLICLPLPAVGTHLYEDRYKWRGTVTSVGERSVAVEWLDADGELVATGSEPAWPYCSPHTHVVG